jgi:hypothetical protein
MEDQISAWVMPGITMGSTITASSKFCPHNLRRLRISAAIRPMVNCPILVKKVYSSVSHSE